MSFYYTCNYGKYFPILIWNTFVWHFFLFCIDVSLPGTKNKAFKLFQSHRVSCECSSAAAAAKSLQSCPTLCDPIDGSPPGSPVPGILQARTLERVAISFSNAWKVKVRWQISNSLTVPLIIWFNTPFIMLIS